MQIQQHKERDDAARNAAMVCGNNNPGVHGQQLAAAAQNPGGAMAQQHNAAPVHVQQLRMSGQPDGGSSG